MLCLIFPFSDMFHCISGRQQHSYALVHDVGEVLFRKRPDLVVKHGADLQRVELKLKTTPDSTNESRPLALLVHCRLFDDQRVHIRGLYHD